MGRASAQDEAKIIVEETHLFTRESGMMTTATGIIAC